MSAYLSMDIDYCRHSGHKFQAAWSDKNPLKVSLICVTCTDAHPGKTAYVAYGEETRSWGTWRRKQSPDQHDE